MQFQFNGELAFYKMIEIIQRKVLMFKICNYLPNKESSRFHIIRFIIQRKVKLMLYAST